jgi:predicted TPR repeat methyltransferase
MIGDEHDSKQRLQEAHQLCVAGRQREAVLIYGDLLTGPHQLEALQRLGRISFQNGDLEAAQYFFGETLKIAPDFVDGLHLRGVALMRLGRNRDALHCLERAVALDSNNRDALLNCSTLLLELKRPNEALIGFERLLSLDPHNAVAWNNRGNALVALRRLNEAVAAYDRAIALDPGLKAAEQNRFYADLSLRDVDRIPGFAVREAFEQVASRYDQMVLIDLQYRAHHHLRSLASRFYSQLTPTMHILDLGCGTGLAGDCFKDLAKGGRLDGVDVSPSMIEQARGRGIYDELFVADFETFLSLPGRRYHLVLSADALVYLGDLALTFAGVAKRLEPHGTFLFTCEAKPNGGGWELTKENRFRHSDEYLQQEADRAGLRWVNRVECTLRYEAGVPVAGFAVAIGSWV